MHTFLGTSWLCFVNPFTCLTLDIKVNQQTKLVIFHLFLAITYAKQMTSVKSKCALYKLKSLKVPHETNMRRT